MFAATMLPGEREHDAQGLNDLRELIDRPLLEMTPSTRGGGKTLQKDTGVTHFGQMRERREIDMLWTIALILGILWLLGTVSSYTMGGFIHLLLVLAVIMVIINIIQGRRATS